MSRPRPSEEDEDDFDDLGPAEEGDYAEDEPATTSGATRTRRGSRPRPGGQTGEEDLLAEQPEFVDEATDEEDLWFEKGPPKDFDFEDER